MSTDTFASVDYDSSLSALRFRGGYLTGTSAVHCSAPVVANEFPFYNVKATLLARSLEEECTLEVSTDLGASWTVATLDGDDDGINDDAYHGVVVSQVVVAEAATAVELQLTLQDANWWDFCYVRNVSIVALNINPEDLTVPKELFFDDFEEASAADSWSNATADGASSALCMETATVAAKTTVDLMMYTGISIFAWLTDGSASTCVFVAQVDGINFIVADGTDKIGIIDVGGVLTPEATLFVDNTAATGTCCIELAGVSGEEL